MTIVRINFYIIFKHLFFSTNHQADTVGSCVPFSPIINLMWSESASLEDGDQESVLLPEGPSIHSGPSTPNLHYLWTQSVCD